jgi:exopolysaccharide/PEP-CTERM locus tyrosine autokinase
MSTVEKAAEKLRAAQAATPSPDGVLPETPAAVPVEPAPMHAAPGIERLQERTLAAHHAAVAPASSSSWHVDRKTLERAGLLPSGLEANGRLVDEMRRIKRPLMANAFGKGVPDLAHPERIVVTSAVSGEGKSFTALNLAMSLACEPDFEVLLVDGDVPKSHLTHVLGLQKHAGLMDVLANEQMAPADVIVRTDVPNLLVVPSGKRHPLAAELVGSLRMDFVLNEFAGRDGRRLVLFDSSPLLATSESQVLVSHMGQVVMVVAAARTARHAVDTALQLLTESQYVGLMLNMSQLPASESYYDSYYGQLSVPRAREA